MVGHGVGVGRNLRQRLRYKGKGLNCGSNEVLCIYVFFRVAGLGLVCHSLLLTWSQSASMYRVHDCILPLPLLLRKGKVSAVL